MNIFIKSVTHNWKLNAEKSWTISSTKSTSTAQKKIAMLKKG